TMGRPIHFEIPAGDPERLIDFYTKVFGWSFNRWGSEPYWLIKTGEGQGIDGGLMKRKSPEAQTVNTIQVDSLDKSLEAVKASGGTEAVPKIAIPGVGWLAYCKDPEGTLFGMMEMDQSAKR